MVKANATQPMRRLILAAALFLAGCDGTLGQFNQDGSTTTPALAPSTTTTTVASSAPTSVVVGHIIDGDTFEPANSTQDVRLVGIDTPETRHPKKGKQCFGPEAKQRLTQLIPPGTTVRLEFDKDERDHYGRWLAYVFAGDVHVNRQMVAEGLAGDWAIRPNTRYAQEFKALDDANQAAGRGLYEKCPREDWPVH